MLKLAELAAGAGDLEKSKVQMLVCSNSRNLPPGQVEKRKKFGTDGKTQTTGSGERLEKAKDDFCTEVNDLNSGAQANEIENDNSGSRSAFATREDREKSRAQINSQRWL